MATINQPLNSPEDKFKRYDQFSGFYYTGFPEIRDWGRYGNTKGANVKIYLKGVNIIRFINFTHPICSKNGEVYINDNLSEYTFTSYSERMTYNNFILEIPLQGLYNKIVINNPENIQINFNAIDVNESGVLVTKEEYEQNYNKYYLIYTRNKYFNINGDILVPKNNIEWFTENSFLLPIKEKISMDKFKITKILF